MMNQGARNKLRNMGGIMASSPKLMQAAFQAGGPVMPVPPSMQFNDAAGGRIAPPVVGLGRIAPMMPPPAMSGAAPMMPTESAPGRFVAGRGLDTSVTDSFFGGTDLGQPAFSVDDLLLGPAPVEDEPPVQQPPMNAGEVGAPTPRRPQRATPVEDEPPVQQPPALEGLTVPPELLERVARTVQDDTNLVPGSVEDTDTDTGDTGTGTGEPRRLPRPAPAPSKRDLRSRYNEKIKLFKEIYGEDDEDRARDKAMSLAMLGLAIAAGQSPDALTNIAQGTMAGLQGMSEQEQARREREQGLRGLALETAIGEQAQEAEAAARAAEQVFDRDTRLQVAELRGGGADGTERSRAEYRYNEVFKQTYESLVNPDPLSGRQPAPIAQAVRQAQEAAQQAAPNAPSAQSDAPAAPPAPTTPTTQDGISEEEAAAALGL